MSTERKEHRAMYRRLMYLASFLSLITILQLYNICQIFGKESSRSLALGMRNDSEIHEKVFLQGEIYALRKM